jgi:hypothetical protein
MAVYKGGEDLAQRIRAQSFSREGNHALRPHKATDSLHRLHERLGCHKQYSIPIGFFYAKWSEKLHFHLSKLQRQERGLSLKEQRQQRGLSLESSSSRSRTPSPRKAPPLSRSARETSPTMTSSPAASGSTYEEAEEGIRFLQEARAVIFDDTMDRELSLTKHHKAVFWYRKNRKQEWLAAEAGTMMNESEWNARHDQQALENLQKREEEMETLIEEHKKSIGYGPAGQGSN